MIDNSASAFDLLIVTGPTASGKTSLAVLLADRLNGEIISADSRQVYRQMDLGTGKDYSDYSIYGKTIPSHLLDIVDPGYKYNVFEYQRDFLKIYYDLKVRKRFPVVCGGSGMYIDSIVSGYKMFEVPPDLQLRSSLEKKSMNELIDILSTCRELHNTTDIDTRKRAIRAIEIESYNKNRPGKKTPFPEVRPLVVGLMFDRLKRRERITMRLNKRLENGMVDEVKELLDRGLKPADLIYYGLEYKYITLYLTGRLTYDEMLTQLEIAIHQFAKRQMTWFRGMERRGIKIHWIDGGMPPEDKVGLVLKLLGDPLSAKNAHT
ncbi:MAG: tRNA (adenosine(37)-N6)-dimethylallyltransferase MiaA [Bacteroidales bacterium]